MPAPPQQVPDEGSSTYSATSATSARGAADTPSPLRSWHESCNPTRAGRPSIMSGRNAGRVCGSDWGVSTTGVAGPEPSGGMPVGTVYVAVASASMHLVGRLQLSGGRGPIRQASVVAALALLVKALR